MRVPDLRFYELAAKRGIILGTKTYIIYQKNPRLFKLKGCVNPFNSYNNPSEFRSFEDFLLDIIAEENGMKEKKQKLKLLKKTIEAL